MRTIPEAVKEELAALAEMSDEDIDFSDIPETSAQDWSGAVRGRFCRPGAGEGTILTSDDGEVVEILDVPENLV